MRKIWIQCIIIMLLLSGCSTKETGGNEEANKENSAVLNNSGYEINNDKVDILGFDLEVPFISYSGNSNKEEKLNELIKDSIKSYLGSIGIESEAGEMYIFEYSIENQSENKLSILFTLDYYRKDSAHPTLAAFAININMADEKLYDLYEVKEQIKEYALSSFRRVKKRENSLDSDDGYIENKTMNDACNEMTEYSFYYTDKGIGLIFEVPYAVGGYSIYEIDFSNSTKQPEWQQAYDNKLADLLKDESVGENTVFLTKDLDNNDVSELIVKEEMEITVYTFDEQIVEVGNYDFATATTSFHASENTEYPGIFYFNTSGGLNHCGYVSIKEGQLNVEELWNEDYSGMSEELGLERDRIEKISEDDDLIAESNEVQSINKELVFDELR